MFQNHHSELFKKITSKASIQGQKCAESVCCLNSDSSGIALTDSLPSWKEKVATIFVVFLSHWTNRKSCFLADSARWSSCPLVRTRCEVILVPRNVINFTLDFVCFAFIDLGDWWPCTEIVSRKFLYDDRVSLNQTIATSFYYSMLLLSLFFLLVLNQENVRTVYRETYWNVMYCTRRGKIVNWKNFLEKLI